MSKSQMHGLDPIEDMNSRVLILGTFPGSDSLSLRQYYAYPRNVFWRIMAELLHFDPNVQYEQKIQALKSNGIALWDVLASCDREGAADSKIQNPMANDFKDFFDEHKKLEKLFFNGRKAEKLFFRFVQKRSAFDRIPHFYLPSTSPAYARMSFEEKLTAWRCVAD